jgi:hypothetical protein
MRVVMAEAERRALARERGGRARKIQRAFRAAALVKEQLSHVESAPSQASHHPTEARRRKRA